MYTTTTNVYEISTIRQLVDLNQDMTNFSVDFQARSLNKEPFECLVIDQQTLDEQEELKYKKVPNGVINGSVSSDKNVYMSYYLILRSETPCQVEVTLQIQKLDDNLPLLSDPGAGGVDNPYNHNNNQEVVEPPVRLKDKIMKWLKNWKIIFAIVVIIIVIIYVIKSNKKPKEPTIVTTFFPRKDDSPGTKISTPSNPTNLGLGTVTTLPPPPRPSSPTPPVEITKPEVHLPKPTPPAAPTPVLLPKLEKEKPVPVAKPPPVNGLEEELKKLKI